MFVESHPHRSLDPFSGLIPISYPLRPNSFPVISFANHHPLNSIPSIFYKNMGRGASLALPCSSFQSSRDENPVTATPLLPSLTNRDTRNSFRIRSYAKWRVSLAFSPNSRTLHVPLSPLAATLIHFSASVANKRLTASLNPSDATLTKNRGWGILPILEQGGTRTSSPTTSTRSA